MTRMPLCMVSISPPAFRVSAQPLMAVSGVRSSWDAEEMNSFFMVSVAESSSAIWLMAVQRSPISSLPEAAIRTEKSPFANFSAVALICRMGNTMERIKYMPDRASSRNTPMHSRVMATEKVRMLASISVREMTIRTAVYSSDRSSMG